MSDILVMQGRELRSEDIALIHGLLDENPKWGRTRLSVELCDRWDWRNAQGRHKDMAARTLLLKLERAGLIRLPPRRGGPSEPNKNRNRIPPPVPAAAEPINSALCDLQPLMVNIITPGSEDLQIGRASCRERV